MIRAGIYCRVSTEEQAKNGISLQCQQEALTKFALNNNYAIVDYYIELRGGKDSPTKEFFEVPKGITITGGKTGNTFDAGSCILLYGHDSKETPFIAIIMGASSRRNLYDNMTFLLAAIE